MPQITKAQSNHAPDLYGAAQNDNAKLFRERLMDRFAAHEFVTVINVDDEPVYWQYMPMHKEQTNFTPDGKQTITEREDPELWMLDPGETTTPPIVGENAYIMIETLYKKLVAKKMVSSTPDQEPTQARNFNYSDGVAQEKWIDKIYVGKAGNPFQANVQKDLGIHDAGSVKELVGTASAKK